MADHRGKSVGPDKLEVVPSFCYLEDMLSVACGCELSITNRCENSLEEVQGTATSSIFLPPLFQDMRPCVQLLCAERNAPCQWDLALDKTETFNAYRGMTWQWSDRSAMSSHKTLLPLGRTSCMHSLASKIWTSSWRRKRLRWYGHIQRSNGAIKSAYDIQVEGKWRLWKPKMTW